MDAEPEVRSQKLEGRSQRWITIGTVQTGWFVFERQWGTPDGLLMVWQGRTHVFQSRQFRQWEELLWAVVRRVNLARMYCAAIASEVPRGTSTVKLRVLVRPL